MMNPQLGRPIGVICGTCGDVFREVSWVQPSLIEGEGGSVAFRERGCLCGWVPVGVDTVTAPDMRQFEAAHEQLVEMQRFIADQFLPGAFENTTWDDLFPPQ